MSQYSVEAILKATGADQFAKAFENAGKSVEGLKKTGESVGKIGSSMMKGITLPVLGIGTAVMAVGKQYEESMSSVQAISGATADEMDKLRSVAREMGATTRYSASESADAMGYMALAGWDVEQMTSALPGVLNLATAGNLDLAKASDIVTDTMSMFGMEAKDAGKASDIFAAAQSKSNTNVEQLSEALLNAGPAASSAGASLEQTSAILGVFANQGLKGGRAGTTLNALFRDIKNSAENGAIAIGKTSVSVYDASGNMRAMGDIMKDVEGATQGLTTEQRDAALAGVFQQQSLSGVNMLLSAGSEEVSKLEKELYNSNGTAQEMAGIMDDNLGGALANMKSALEEVALGFFDLAGGPMTAFIQKVTEIITWFSSLSDSTKQWILIVAGIAAAIGPVLVVIGSLITHITTIAGLFTAGASGVSVFSAAIAFITGPVGIAIAAITAIIGVLVYLYNTNETVREAIHTAWEFIKDTISNVVSYISDFVREVWGGMTSWYTENQELILESTRTVWEWIQSIIGDVLAVVVPATQEAWDLIKTYTQVVWETIKGIISVAIELIKGIIKTTMQLITGDWSGAWETIKSTLTNAWEIMKSTSQNISEIIRSYVSEKFNALKEAIKSKVEEAKNAVSEKFQQIKDSVQTKVSEAKQAVRDKFNEMVSAIRTKAEEAVTKVKTMGSDILTAVQNVDLFAAGKAIIGSLFDGLKAKWEGVKGWLSGLGDTIKSLKGPMRYDKVMLLDEGKAIMGGLDRGLTESFKKVKRNVSGMGSQIQKSLNTSPVMDINGSIARSNAQVNSAVRHELGNNSYTPQPAHINFRMGSQVYRGFVTDIMNADGEITDLEAAYLGG